MKDGDADGRASPIREKYDGKYDMVRALKESCVLRGQTEIPEYGARPRIIAVKKTEVTGSCFVNLD